MRVRWWILSALIVSGLAVMAARLSVLWQPRQPARPVVSSVTAPLAHSGEGAAPPASTGDQWGAEEAWDEDEGPVVAGLGEGPAVEFPVPPVGTEPSGAAYPPPDRLVPVVQQPPPPPVQPPPIVSPPVTPAVSAPALLMGGGFLVQTTEGAATGPTTTTPGTSPGGQSGTGGTSAGTTPSAPADLTTTVVTLPPRFREVGVAIGDAFDVQSANASFPLTLTFTFDPREPHLKGVPPELIQAYFFDPSSGRWSTDGLALREVRVSEGRVTVETTHLTVFRLGVPRGAPPLIHQIRPPHAPAGASLTLWGDGFSASAAHNLVHLDGALVTIAVDASGTPQPLRLGDAGETLTFRTGAGTVIDQAELPAAPAGGSSWTRVQDAVTGAFVRHADASGGQFFSPGATLTGQPFAFLDSATPQPPQPGEALINEVLLSPPPSFLGDANGDGETHPLEDEFIEIVNTTTHTLALDGCVLSTREGARHHVPAGTLLPGGMALVVFGVDDAAHPPRPSGPFGGSRALSDVSQERRLVVRLPEGPPGTAWVTATALRQTSNPIPIQILMPLAALGRQPGFEAAANRLPPLAGHTLRSLRPHDVDRDLDFDVVAIDGERGLLVLLNDGSGRFALAPDAVALPDGRAHFFDLALADLTDDGAPELIIGDTDAAGSYVQLLVFTNTGAGRWSFRSRDGTLTGPASAGPSTIEVGDVDADRDLDVIVGMAGEDPLLFRQDSQGAFPHDPAGSLPLSSAILPSGTETADLDQDGDLDLLLSASRAGLGTFSDVHLLLNLGAGAFEDATAARWPMVTEGVDGFALGDLDGDADVDVVTASPDFAPRVYRAASGTFALERPQPLSGVRAAAVALADLDGDADLDLIFGQPPQDRVYLNDGAGQFTALADLPAQAGDHREVLPFDIDRDGDVDLLTGGPELTVFLNTGTRINHSPQWDPVTAPIALTGQLLQLNVRARDPDDDVLTLTAALQDGQPITTLGATFDDQGGGQGALQWTPTAQQGSRIGLPYELIFRAHDGLATAQQIVQVLVQDGTNHRPTLTPIAPRTIREQVALTILVQAQDADAGEVLQLGAINLPAGATFDAAAGRFQWTPGPQQGDGPTGRRLYQVTFTVTDLAHATNQLDVEITVLDRQSPAGNQPPILEPTADQTIAEGRALQIPIRASDADGDLITLRVAPLPLGARLTEQQTGQWLLEWVPGQAQSGVYPLRVEATDGFIASPVTDDVTITVTDNPGFQRLAATIGKIEGDAAPLATAGLGFGDLAPALLSPGTSVVLDLGEFHPALVSVIELYNAAPTMDLEAADLQLLVSDNNQAYQLYGGPMVVTAALNRLSISNLAISQRYIKVHRLATSGPLARPVTNVLSEIARASGAISFSQDEQTFFDDLARRTFALFEEQVNVNGLAPDRVTFLGGRWESRPVYSTGATGFWLASLPIAAERGWMSRDDAAAAAARTLKLYLGLDGGPVAGFRGFYYHFLNGDGTRFTGFAGDGVSILDSSPQRIVMWRVYRPGCRMRSWPMTR